MFNSIKNTVEVRCNLRRMAKSKKSVIKR